MILEGGSEIVNDKVSCIPYQFLLNFRVLRRFVFSFSDLLLFHLIIK